MGVNASPLAILAQLAGATTKLRLAPAVTLLPVHHPLHVAEEWATLDLLSGGRVDFEKVSRLVIAELRSGEIGKICLETPETRLQELAELEIIRQQKAEKKAARQKHK